MSDPELLPCPFCGHGAEYETTTTPNDECHCVCCPDCNFSLMSGRVGIGWFPTKVDAARAWNHRAPTAVRYGKHCDTTHQRSVL